MLEYDIFLDALYWIVTSSYLGILLYQAYYGFSCRGGWWASHSFPIAVYYMLFVLLIVTTLLAGYYLGLSMSMVQVGCSLEGKYGL